MNVKFRPPSSPVPMRPMPTRRYASGGLRDPEPLIVSYVTQERARHQLQILLWTVLMIGYAFLSGFVIGAAMYR
jgi:hypothetical protein